jgi:hypothetical protein
MLFSMVAGTASAETAAETASKWGLIGRWSLDCGLPPDRDRGAVLAYEIGADGRLVYRRDFGDTSDAADVIAAEISADNLLNLRVFFPKLKQTREYGLKMEPDGSIRAFYNRDRKGRYSIRNGRFAGSGQPTPPNHKCNAEAPVRLPASPRSAARSRPANLFGGPSTRIATAVARPTTATIDTASTKAMRARRLVTLAPPQLPPAHCTDSRNCERS